MPFPRVYPLQWGSSVVPPLGENWLAKDFIFSDASPLLCFPMKAGWRIITCQVVIQVPFNDAAATLKVGNLGLDDRYMTDTENNPLETGEYEANPYEYLLADEDIYLTIAPGASIQGRGTVLMEFDQL